MFKKNMRRVILLGFTTALLGCGFQLRQAVELPYKTIYLGGVMTQDLRLYLTRLFKTGLNSTMVMRPDQAELLLNIIETPSKQILSYDASGNITGYRLIEKVNFSINNQDGDELISPSDLFLTRDMDFSVGSPAAGENLETLLFSDMRQDVSAQIMRRLGTLGKKKPLKP